MTKNGLSSPMDCGCSAPSPHSKGNNGVYDHHTTPAFSKPHDVGKDGVKEIFFATVPYKTIAPDIGGSLRGGTSIKGK